MSFTEAQLLSRAYAVLMCPYLAHDFSETLFPPLSPNPELSFPISHTARSLEQLSEPLPTGALEKVQVLMSEQGESCDAACTKAGGGRRCSAQHLALLNSCDSLREHVGCEAGCEPGDATKGAEELPAYVDGNAPKAQMPAMCYTAPEGSAPGCGGKDAQSRRLCACGLS